jgi:subtilase family serine protease
VTALTGISVTVTNIGNGQAGGAFVVAITLRGNLPFPPLAPGASATVTFNCVDNVMAIVDPDNRVQESNEDNNTAVFPSICIL